MKPNDVSAKLSLITNAYHHHIQCEDTFTRNVQANIGHHLVGGWNERRNALMLSIWKLRSKVEDLKLDVESNAATINVLLEEAKSLVKASVTKDRTNRTREIMNIRKAHEYIESLYEDYATTKLKKVLVYRNKATRMVKKIKEEEKYYFTDGAEAPFKIIDPDLNINTIKEFVIYASETAVLATDVQITFSEHYCDFLDTRIDFCEKVYENLDVLPTITALLTPTIDAAVGTQDMEDGYLNMAEIMEFPELPNFSWKWKLCYIFAPFMFALLMSYVISSR